MENLSQGENSFFKQNLITENVIQDNVTCTMSDEAIVSSLEEIESGLLNVRQLVTKLYVQYRTSEISSILNSLELSGIQLEKIQEKVKKYGK